MPTGWKQSDGFQFGSVRLGLWKKVEIFCTPAGFKAKFTWRKIKQKPTYILDPLSPSTVLSVASVNATGSTATVIRVLAMSYHFKGIDDN